MDYCAVHLLAIDDPFIAFFPSRCLQAFCSLLEPVRSTARLRMYKTRQRLTFVFQEGRKILLPKLFVPRPDMNQY